MDYYVFNIGKPAVSDWWTQNIKRGVITAGFEGNPEDKGAAILKKMNEGDWVLAFVNGRGFVGAGHVQDIDTYRLHPSLPSNSLSDHRHERGVNWVHYVRDVKDAVTVASVGGHAPRQTMERLRNQEQAESIIALLAQRPGSLREDGYQCELWGANGWRTVTVTYALARPEAIVRWRCAITHCWPKRHSASTCRTSNRPPRMFTGALLRRNTHPSSVSRSGTAGLYRILQPRHHA